MSFLGFGQYREGEKYQIKLDDDNFKEISKEIFIANNISKQWNIFLNKYNLDVLRDVPNYVASDFPAVHICLIFLYTLIVSLKNKGYLINDYNLFKISSRKTKNEFDKIIVICLKERNEDYIQMQNSTSFINSKELNFYKKHFVNYLGNGSSSAKDFLINIAKEVGPDDVALRSLSDSLFGIFLIIELKHKNNELVKQQVEQQQIEQEQLRQQQIKQQQTEQKQLRQQQIKQQQIEQQQIEQKQLRQQVKQLTKGERLSLDCLEFDIIFNWNCLEDITLDTNIFLLGENNKVLSDNHFIFFNNTKSPCNSINIINTKKISINLNKIESKINKILFIITIDNEYVKNATFKDIKNLSLKITNSKNIDLLEYQLNCKTFSKETAIDIGEIYMRNNKWIFKALGNGFNSGLKDFCDKYGVNTD